MSDRQFEEMRQQRDELVAQAEALLSRGGDAPLEGGDLEEYERLSSEIERVNTRHEQIEALARAALDPRNCEPGTSPGPHEEVDAWGRAIVRGFGNGPQLVRGRDPWAEPAARMAPDELRSRALDAVERSRVDDDAKERATKTIEAQPPGEIAEWALATSRPEYRDAFGAYIRGEHATWSDVQRHAVREAMATRAAMSLTAANGGYLMPFELDPSVILTNVGATNPFRQIARVIQTQTNIWHGVSSAGVTASVLPEAQEVTDNSPTFSQPTVQIYKHAAYLQASYELLQDTGIETEIAMLLADARDRLEATEFATGNGSTEPQGVISKLALTTASRVAGSSGAAGSADLTINDLYALKNALPPRYRQGASWVAETSTWSRVRALGATYGSAFWAELGVATPAQLLGAPAYESSAMDATIVSGSNDDVVVLGDFRQGMVIADRVGMSIVRNDVVLGSNRRPTGEAGFLGYWRSGSDLVNVDAFRLLRL